eukprot:373229-Pelagomonas_calceolata.AAC.4
MLWEKAPCLICAIFICPQPSPLQGLRQQDKTTVFPYNAALCCALALKVLQCKHNSIFVVVSYALRVDQSIKQEVSTSMHLQPAILGLAAAQPWCAPSKRIAYFNTIPAFKIPDLNTIVLGKRKKRPGAVSISCAGLRASSASVWRKRFFVVYHAEGRGSRLSDQSSQPVLVTKLTTHSDKAHNKAHNQAQWQSSQQGKCQDDGSMGNAQNMSKEDLRRRAEAL